MKHGASLLFGQCNPHSQDCRQAVAPKHGSPFGPPAEHHPAAGTVWLVVGVFTGLVLLGIYAALRARPRTETAP